MNRPRLACGHRTDNPYFFEKMMAKVFSPEELCYCIMLDAYLLDDSFVNEELVNWLGEDCGLDELAGELKNRIKRGISVDEFARAILEYIGFYSKDIIDETCEVIRDNASLTKYEKDRARADYYLMCGHIRLALTTYNELLESIPEKEKVVRAAIWHNCGFAYTRLFQYEAASKAFFYSYKLIQNNETLKQFLTALRMYKSDEEYLEYISSHPQMYEISQKVERAIHQAESQFEGTDEYRMLAAMKVLREEGDTGMYYSRLDEITNELKTSFREMVSV